MHLLLVFLFFLQQRLLGGLLLLLLHQFLHLLFLLFLLRFSSLSLSIRHRNYHVDARDHREFEPDLFLAEVFG